MGPGAIDMGGGRATGLAFGQSILMWESPGAGQMAAGPLDVFVSLGKGRGMGEETTTTCA